MQCNDNVTTRLQIIYNVRNSGRAGVLRAKQLKQYVLFNPDNSIIKHSGCSGNELNDGFIALLIVYSNPFEFDKIQITRGYHM